MIEKELNPNVRNYDLEGISCIYALCCPITKEVKYVGSTINLRRRLDCHRNTTSADKNPFLRTWFDELKEKRLEPFPLILKRCHEIYFYEYEKFYIKLFMDSDELLNRNFFGLQNKHIDTDRAKAIIIKTNVTFNEIGFHTNIDGYIVRQFINGNYPSMKPEKAKLIQDYIFSLDTENPPEPA